ncbi:MAG TPA: LuxR C-terminal-related transcriptional regulator [Bacteroidales bacterium]|nr:LuxR C-terminal-related transcriptional regulator [Bacteroidales bacterium]
MDDTQYFSHLYEIASHLNKEFSLPAALRKSLEKTVELLHLGTGWIWLVQPDVKSVYLAASYNLPPALGDHPERLSGWCFCIEKYLSNEFDKGRNISEIRCTRLKDIKTGTGDLKFHATIPITTSGQKVGLMNLVSKESQQFDEKQLSILNTISELIGMAIQRTRLQESQGIRRNESMFHDVLERVLHPRIDALINRLNQLKSDLEVKNLAAASESIKLSLDEAGTLNSQLSIISDEADITVDKKAVDKDFHYPSSPLTRREIEVLDLVRKGLTNKQIADQLYISARTVKFHISSIFSKLYASNRIEAVNTAIRRGLLGNE